MSDKTIYVVREKNNGLVDAYNRIRLFNGMIVCGILLVTLYNALIEVDKKKQKGA